MPLSGYVILLLGQYFYCDEYGDLVTLLQPLLSLRPFVLLIPTFFTSSPCLKLSPAASNSTPAPYLIYFFLYFSPLSYHSSYCFPLYLLILSHRPHYPPLPSFALSSPVPLRLLTAPSFLPSTLKSSPDSASSSFSSSSDILYFISPVSLRLPTPPFFLFHPQIIA